LGGGRAEYAAVVKYSWQGRGLGTTLTNRLIKEAHDRGVAYLYALVTPDNERMLSLLRGLGLPRRERREGEAEHVEVDLCEPGA